MPPLVRVAFVTRCGSSLADRSSSQATHTPACTEQYDALTAGSMLASSPIASMGHPGPSKQAGCSMSIAQVAALLVAALISGGVRLAASTMADVFPLRGPSMRLRLTAACALRVRI